MSNHCQMCHENKDEIMSVKFQYGEPEYTDICMNCLNIFRSECWITSENYDENKIKALLELIHLGCDKCTTKNKLLIKYIKAQK